MADYLQYYVDLSNFIMCEEMCLYFTFYQRDGERQWIFTGPNKYYVLTLSWNFN